MPIEAHWRSTRLCDALSNLAIALRLLDKPMKPRASPIGRCSSTRDHTDPHRAADAHADHGEFAESEQWLRRAIGIDPDCASVAGLAHLRTMNRGDTWWLEGAQRIAAGKSPNRVWKSSCVTPWASTSTIWAV